MGRSAERRDARRRAGALPAHRRRLAAARHHRRARPARCRRGSCSSSPSRSACATASSTARPSVAECVARAATPRRARAAAVAVRVAAHDRQVPRGARRRRTSADVPLLEGWYAEPRLRARRHEAHRRGPRRLRRRRVGGAVHGPQRARSRRCSRATPTSSSCSRPIAQLVPAVMPGDWRFALPEQGARRRRVAGARGRTTSSASWPRRAGRSSSSCRSASSRDNVETLYDLDIVAARAGRGARHGVPPLRAAQRLAPVHRGAGRRRDRPSGAPPVDGGAPPQPDAPHSHG